MFGHDIVVIGASAGGVDALPRLIGSLPADLPASVFVVLHIPPHGRDLMPKIIRRTASLSVAHAVAGESVRKGHVYVAPPDRHLQLDGRRVRLSHGPRENFHRPSIDALFRTAAESYGPRVAAVVLTGNLDDGTAGLHAVKKRGGIAIVQDPRDALVPAMPQSALRIVKVNHCVPLAKIGPLLIRLATTHNVPKTKNASRIEKRSMSPKLMEKEFGLPTSFVCPECNGPLWETKPGAALQFRCHVGHAYSPESLLADQADGLERALWSALRTFGERAELLRRLGRRKYRAESLGKNVGNMAKELEHQAEFVRKLLRITKRD
ncbi:MAG TPA: chemotaxis protein CheB [Verrucomicrobiae bacterium]|nr:chemotaxis protein CheB [Verrucomicrobiae bacterium]